MKKFLFMIILVTITALNTFADDSNLLYPPEKSEVGDDWVITVDDYAYRWSEFETLYDALETQLSQLAVLSGLEPTREMLQYIYLEELLPYFIFAVKAVDEGLAEMSESRDMARSAVYQLLANIYLQSAMPSEEYFYPTDDEVQEYYELYESQIIASGYTEEVGKEYIFMQLAQSYYQTWQDELVATLKEERSVKKNRSLLNNTDLEPDILRAANPVKEDEFDIYPHTVDQLGDDWILSIDNYGLRMSDFLYGYDFVKDDLETLITSTYGITLDESEMREVYLDETLPTFLIAIDALDYGYHEQEEVIPLIRYTVYETLATIYLEYARPDDDTYFDPDDDEVNAYYALHKTELKSLGGATQIKDYIKDQLIQENYLEWQSELLTTLTEEYKISRNWDLLDADSADDLTDWEEMDMDLSVGEFGLD